MAQPSASFPSASDGLDELRVDFERLLMEADRMMMQTVQTALALIGFGFSINAFFNDVAESLGAPGGGVGARLMGILLMFIGIQLLAMGTWTQAAYRRDLIQRYVAAAPAASAWIRKHTRFTPSFLSAVLLLIAGIFSLCVALCRWLL